MTATVTERAGAVRARDQRVAFYHPTAKGDGSALRLEPRVNRTESDRHNCFYLDMAPQKTVASREAEQRSPATFDWERKLTVKLGFSDICELLAVLEGRQEKAGGARNGLYHESEKAVTVISFTRNAERGGHLVGISRKDKEGGLLVRLHMALGEAESVGLRCILQSGLFYLSFHSQIFSFGDSRKVFPEPSLS